MIKSINLAVSHGGSLGDCLNLSAVTAAIKKQFPQTYITVIICNFPEVFRDNKTVDRVVHIPTASFQQYVDKVKSNYDIYLEYRYAAKWHFSESVLKIPEILEFKKYTDSRFKKYRYIFDSFLKDIPAMNRKGLSHYEVTSRSSGLDIQTSDMFLSVHPEDFKASNKFKGLKFCVINDSSSGGIQTKNWYKPYWKDVNKHLRRIGILPIQVGVEKDIQLEGSERFVGTIFETAALIKNAEFTISGEGGIVHLAKTVGTKSIVLFGPTNIHVFGYPENINLRSNVCSPCYWKQPDWFTRCSLINQKVKETWAPPCMKALEPKHVIKAINKLLVKKGYKMKYLEPTSEMDEASLKTSLWHKEQDILKKSMGTKQYFFEEEAIKLPLDATVGYKDILQQKRVQAICEMVGYKKSVVDCGGGDGYIANLLKLQDNTVTVLDISEIRCERARWIHKLKAIQHDLTKPFPFKDKSVDVCLLAEVVEHVINPFDVLKEAQRIIKPGGKIIFTVPVHKSHDEYYQHFWAIRQKNIEDNMLVLSMEKILPHIEEFEKIK